jgi:hypothetical protein
LQWEATSDGTGFNTANKEVMTRKEREGFRELFEN